jgi:hypothetical protein
MSTAQLPLVKCKTWPAASPESDVRSNADMSQSGWPSAPAENLVNGHRGTASRLIGHLLDRVSRILAEVLKDLASPTGFEPVSPP